VSTTQEADRAGIGSRTIAALVTPSLAFGDSAGPPSWRIAALAACALTWVGVLLSEPIIAHVLLAPDGALARSGVLNAGTESSIRAILWVQVALAPIGVAFTAAWYFSAMVLVAVLMARTNLARLLWGLSVHGALISTAVVALLAGAIGRLRPLNEFASASDMYRIIPSLAFLSTSSNPHVLALLASVNPVLVWAAVVLYTGFRKITALGAVPSTLAVAAAIIPGVALSSLMAR